MKNIYFETSLKFYGADQHSVFHNESFEDCSKMDSVPHYALHIRLQL
jgi:hypothetical protein